MANKAGSTNVKAAGAKLNQRRCAMRVYILFFLNSQLANEFINLNFNSVMPQNTGLF